MEPVESALQPADRLQDGSFDEMEGLTARIAGRRLRADATIDPAADVTLEREPDNEHDHWAVRILADGSLVGYLEAGLARLVAPMLDRGRPVAAAPSGHQHDINLFVPNRRERVGGNLVWVVSSDGTKRYLVDRLHGLCSCPAGRFVYCRHQRAVGAPARPRPPQVKRALPVTVGVAKTA